MLVPWQCSFILLSFSFSLLFSMFVVALVSILDYSIILLIISSSVTNNAQNKYQKKHTREIDRHYFSRTTAFPSIRDTVIF